MKINNLDQLFLHELKDLYDAEHQLLDTLPRMAEAAGNPGLRAAFENHLVETRGHVTRLEVVFGALGEEPDRKTCKAMKGLIAEGKRVMKDAAAPDVVDAGLISAAQRVEHYEIAAYGTLVAWARTSGRNALRVHLEATLAEEKAADQKLTGLAESGVNLSAATDDDGPEPKQAALRMMPGDDFPEVERRALDPGADPTR